MFLVPLFLAGLAMTSHDRRDRWIYGTLAVATLAALIHFGQVPPPTHWHLHSFRRLG
jgi:hypothetical protein